jgi:hypothetical protein
LKQKAPSGGGRGFEALTMPTNISVEKVKELIRLAERAQADPSGRADDPQRGGPVGAEGVTLPATPPEPQPAADWRTALRRYLEDLPDAALDEIVALYRMGGGAALAQDPTAGPSSGDAPHADRVAFIISRPDLTRCLRVALERM